MRIVYQITDSSGAPQGGHVFEAPDAGALAQSVADFQATLDPTWTMAQVADETQVVDPPPIVLPGP